MVVRIEIDRSKCIGCGSCVAVCPKNWELAKDGKSKPLKTKVNEIECNEKAAEVCPVKCIRIIKLK